MTKRAAQVAKGRNTPNVEVRNLKALIDHPNQQRFFDPLSAHDLSELTDDIRRHGLREKIEVLPHNKAGLPENTIISGHQRRRALLQLGLVETEVLVRYDLAEADTAAIERVFLEANQNRRQLDMLAKARVALRLYELERKRPRGSLSLSQERDARDRVGKVIGKSGRTLNRYWRVLRTPVEVQNAVREAKLRVTLAEKVADLDPKTQATIVDRIRAKESPKAVILEYTAAAKGQRCSPKVAAPRLIRSLELAVSELGDRVDQIVIAQLRPHLDLLQKAEKLVQRLKLRAAMPLPPTSSVKELCERLNQGLGQARSGRHLPHKSEGTEQ